MTTAALNTSEAMDRCIAACNDCALACNRCAAACLAEGRSGMARCIALISTAPRLAPSPLP